MLESVNWPYWFMIFVCQAVMEVLFTIYLYGLKEKERSMACLSRTGSFFLHSTAIICIVDNNINLIPAGAGVLAGIFLATELKGWLDSGEEPFEGI